MPGHVRETFEPATNHGGSDGAHRSLRYLEWSYDPDSQDTHYNTEFVYLLKEGDLSVQVEHECHVMGLFPRQAWLGLLRALGFQPDIVRGSYGRDLFLARKPPR